jgi:hypothetical protein
MRRQLLGLAAAGALLLGSVSTANAQFAVSVGNPYTGQNFSVSGGFTPYGYGVSTAVNPYPTYAPTSVYVAAPGVTTYSSGYYGPSPYYAPRAYVAPSTYYAPSAYYPATSYSVGVPTVGVSTYSPIYSTGYYGYRPGLWGRPRVYSGYYFGY